ncbi:MAG: uracil-DNA glycosylase, partial [Bacteroidota bacterium]
HEVRSCTKCPLWKSRRHAVPGAGKNTAPVMIIGEAPGQYEDESGEPFVGRSGKLLDEMLEAAGLNRHKHLYITSVVKCRPPKNRNPYQKEIKTCIPYVFEQLDLIQPKLIICLGSVAAKTLIGKNFKISKERGKWIAFKEYSMLPTYHPSAVLRNINLKQTVIADFKEVATKLHKI